MSCCRSSTAENAHSTQLIYYILDRRCRTVSPKNTYPLYFSGSRLVVGSLWKCEESATIWRHCDCRQAILVLTAEAARGHAADRVRAREHTEQNNRKRRDDNIFRRASTYGDVEPPLLIVVHRSSSGRISFDKECCYSYLCWFHHHHTSQWAQWARNYKKMVKCLFCCAAAAAHSVWVSDLKYFCWWENSILCIYVLKIRKPSSTISKFWHTVLMLVSSQSVLLLFVCTTKTDFWKM